MLVLYVLEGSRVLGRLKVYLGMCLRFFYLVSLKQDLRVSRLELADWCRLADEQAPRIGIINSSLPVGFLFWVFFMWVVGIELRS